MPQITKKGKENVLNLLDLLNRQLGLGDFNEAIDNISKEDLDGFMKGFCVKGETKDDESDME